LVVVEYFGQSPSKRPFIEVAPREICKDGTHLEKFYQDIMDRGGEGIILRDPKAAYQPGRSPGFLKHKVFRLKREKKRKRE